MTRAPTYPVNLALAGSSVLVVGGGHVAHRKVLGLLASGARITVVAPDVCDALRNLAGVRVHEREYQRGEVASYLVAVSATGVRSVDEQVYRDATASGIPVNVADVADLCTFTLPAVVRRGDLQIAVSTNGRSPAFASWLRRRLEQVIDERYGEALDVVAEVRDELHAAGHSSEIEGWSEAFDEGFVDLVACGRRDDAKALLVAKLGTAA